jgi:hypothetical protein
MNSVADDLYDAVAPIAVHDQGATRALCEAFATLLQIVVDLSSDTADGPGWSIIMDVDRAPLYALPWLAQLVGVRLPTGLDEQQQRDRIRSTDGFRRGTPAALIGAAQQHLIGDKRVVLRERYPTVGAMLVITYLVETPDDDAVLAAMLEQKAAGLILTYEVRIGQSWQDVKDNNATWQDVMDNYASWEAVRDQLP